MNTTDTTPAAPFRVDAIYNPPIEGIYYEIEFVDTDNARIRDRSGFVSRCVAVYADLIDPYGYAIPRSGLTHTTQQPPFVCSVCHQTKQVPNGSSTTGYGTDPDTGAIICFECIGRIDELNLLSMKPGERTCLYFTDSEGVTRVTNWPGTFSRRISALRTSRHNWGLKRYDFWFTIQGERFHGFQIGDNTQLAHIRKLKPA